MRYPFWKWTQWASWLCVGLSGCLHGQDWRAAAKPPLPGAERETGGRGEYERRQDQGTGPTVSVGGEGKREQKQLFFLVHLVV